MTSTNGCGSSGSNSVLFIRSSSGVAVPDGEKDDILDDSALIDYYDRTMSAARRELGLDTGSTSNPRHRQTKHPQHPHQVSSGSRNYSSRHPEDRQQLRDSADLGRRHHHQEQRHHHRDGLQWRVGDACRARYSVDNIEYEAHIIALKESDCGSICQVEFVGYGNRQTVPVSDLSRSRGDQARHRQKQDAAADAAYEHQQLSQDERDKQQHQQQSPPVRQLDVCQANVRQSDASADPAGMKPEPSVNHISSGGTGGVGTDRGYRLPSLSQPPPPLPCLTPSPSCTPGAEGECARGFERMGPRIPPPPPPIMSNMSLGHDEALANMLMSWYLSGYHTGYYAGSTQQAKPHRL